MCDETFIGKYCTLIIECIRFLQPVVAMPLKFKTSFFFFQIVLGIKLETEPEEAISKEKALFSFCKH